MALRVTELTDDDIRELCDAIFGEDDWIARIIFLLSSSSLQKAVIT